MMRIDKYDGVAGPGRAKLAADWAKEDAFGVGLDVNGRIVKGAGQTGILGVVIASRAMKAGEVADIQWNGDIVDFGVGVAVPGNGSGKVVTAVNATGVLTQAVGVTSATHTVVGHTVEASRFVLRVQFPAVVPA